MVKWDSWFSPYIGLNKNVLWNDEPRWLKNSRLPLRRVWSESSRWCVSHDPGIAAEKTYQHLYGVIHIHIIYVSYWGNFSPNTIRKNYITMIQVVDPMLILLFSLLILGIFWSGGDIRSITSLPKTPWMQLGDRIWTNQTVDASGSPAEKKNLKMNGTLEHVRYGGLVDFIIFLSFHVRWL